MKRQERDVGNPSALRSLAVLAGIGCLLAAGTGEVFAADAAAAAAPERRISHEEGNVVRLKSLRELQALLEKKAIVTVNAIDFDGRQYILEPEYVKAEPVKFPVDAKEIRQPITLIAIPYKVNPDCVLLQQVSVQLWKRYCR
jgi:hypothetical protein